MRPSLCVGAQTMLNFATGLGTALLAAALVGRPVRSGVLSLAAELSYPFYLWHVGAIGLCLVIGARGLPLVLLAFGLTVAIAGFSVRYIERPCMRLAAKASGGSREGTRYKRAVASFRPSGRPAPALLVPDGVEEAETATG